MNNVVFIDLEVNPQNQKVLDYGAIISNGINFHSSKKIDFENFIKDFSFICGHNICHHDSNFLVMWTKSRIKSPQKLLNGQNVG